MKRHGNLWGDVTSMRNLLRAARQARRGKRDRDEVAHFEYDLERNLIAIQDELLSHSYRPGPYRTFTVREPKQRLIAAPCYRDRVVHHALHAVIEPIFDRMFIADTYACRKGKGQHRALDRYTHFARRSSHVLHLDVEKYFPSIDHAICKALLRRKIRDRDVLWLADAIIDSSPVQDAPVHYYPGDTLFTPHERRRGLPIGSLTSQLFANAYLAPIDHLVKDRMGIEGYIRYMDDLVVFGDSPEELHALGRALSAQMARVLRLYAHPRKTLVAPVTEGLSFLGFRLWRARRRLQPRCGRAFARRLRALARDYHARVIDLDDATRSVQGWVAHASHGDTASLRARVLGGVCFSRGEAAQRRARRLVEQRCHELPLGQPQWQRPIESEQ